MTDTILVKSEHPESQGPYVRINKAEFDPAKHERFELTPPPPAAPPAPPAPPSTDPLASLAADWKDKPATELMAIAQAATGRTPADGKEAIAMIEAELAAKVPPPPPPA